MRKIQKHTHYDEIVNYTDAEQLITCTRLFGLDNNLLANVAFTLCITVLQIGSLELCLGDCGSLMAVATRRSW